MRRPPVRTVAIDEAARGEELENVVSRFEHLALERLATTDDVANTFLGFARDANRRELAGAIQARQLGGIALVMLALDPRPFRDERGRDHVAGVAPVAERTVDDVSGRAPRGSSAASPAPLAS